MKQQIRINTFETNSSSTHTLIIIPDDQWEAWEKNELYYVRWTLNKDVKEFVEKNNGRLLYSKEELSQAHFFDDMPKREDYGEDEEYEYEDDLNDYLADSDFVNLDRWESAKLEEDETTYTTKDGEKLHILCKFGYDG